MQTKLVYACQLFESKRECKREREREREGKRDWVTSYMIGVQGNQIMQVPLMGCVKRTRAIDKAMKECDFKLALQLRGGSFQRSMKILKRLESCGTPACGSTDQSPGNKYRFAIMNIGAPAAGTNSCTRAFVSYLNHSWPVSLSHHNFNF